MKNKKKAKIDQAGGKVIVTMNGEPLITESSLEKEKAYILESNPGLKSSLDSLSEKEFDRFIITGLVTQKAIEKYITDNKIDQTPEYKKEMENILRSVRHMVNGKFFEKQYSTTETDAEMNKEKIRKEIAKLPKKYNIVVDESYFADCRECQEFLEEERKLK